MSGNESSFDDKECIVINNGSYRLLAGFSGDKTPRWSIYSLTGKTMPQMAFTMEIMRMQSEAYLT